MDKPVEHKQPSRSCNHYCTGLSPRSNATTLSTTSNVCCFQHAAFLSLLSLHIAFNRHCVNVSRRSKKHSCYECDDRARTLDSACGWRAARSTCECRTKRQKTWTAVGTPLWLRAPIQRRSKTKTADNRKRRCQQQTVEGSAWDQLTVSHPLQPRGQASEARSFHIYVQRNGNYKLG